MIWRQRLPHFKKGTYPQWWWNCVFGLKQFGNNNGNNNGNDANRDSWGRFALQRRIASKKNHMNLKEANLKENSEKNKRNQKPNEQNLVIFDILIFAVWLLRWETRFWEETTTTQDGSERGGRERTSVRLLLLPQILHLLPPHIPHLGKWYFCS